MSLRSSSPLLGSDTVTRAPCAFKNSADATPDLPRPTTSTRLSLSSIKVISPRRHRDTETQRETKSRTRFSPCLRVSVVNSFLSQFQRRQREQRKHQRRDPEADNNFRLRPAHQFEVMMQRGHLEDAFFAQLIRAHLQNHRDCL